MVAYKMIIPLVWWFCNNPKFIPLEMREIFRLANGVSNFKQNLYLNKNGYSHAPL